ncbi:Transposase [Popillia japonica]|uniref:Transposase n=1 Tax=Popillia japonica TaxID=7064 RepID=A0AAW1L7A1_POPJA
MPQLTNVERAVIISKLEDNWSLRRIAAHMHRTEKRARPNGLRKISNEEEDQAKTIWQTEQRTEKRARPNGLRKISNEEEDQALSQYVLENPFTTSVNDCAETHFPGCSKTARRRLKVAGIHNHAPARKPFLTEVNKQNRLNFANEFINRDETISNRSE